MEFLSQLFSVVSGSLLALLGMSNFGVTETPSLPPVVTETVYSYERDTIPSLVPLATTSPAITDTLSIVSPAPTVVNTFIGSDERYVEQRFSGLLSHIHWLLDNRVDRDYRTRQSSSAISYDLDYLDQQIARLQTSQGDNTRDLTVGGDFTDGTLTDFSLTGGTSTNLALLSPTLTDPTLAGNLRTNGYWLSNDGDDEGVFVDAEGRVGIGTSTPENMTGEPKLGILGVVDEDVKLYVQSQGNAPATVGTASDDSLLTIASFPIGFSGTEGGISRSNLSRLLSNGDNLLIHNAFGNIVFSTQGQERFRVDASGNIGIGTTNPAYKLVVSDNGNSGLEFSPAYSGTSNLIQSYNRASSTYSRIDFEASEYRFGIAGTGQMFLDASGRLGLGIGPSSKLQIETNLDSSDGVFIRNSNAGTLARAYLSVVSDGGEAVLSTYSEAHSAWADQAVLSANAGLSNGLALLTASTTPIKFWTNNLQRMMIDATGNVGIGTTAPGTILETIVGSSALSIRNSTAVSSRTLYLKHDGTNAILDTSAYGAGTGGDIVFQHNSTTELVRITSTGNVGIGTTAPLSKLGVLGSASIGATYGAIAAPTSGLIVEGNVGIGTTTPNRTLSVQSDGLVSSEFFSNNTSAYIDTFDASGDAVRLGSFNGVPGIAGSLTTVPAISLLPSGNVGIGTTSPSRALEVSGDIELGDNATYLRSITNSGTSVRMLGINGGNVAYVGPIDPGPVATLYSTGSDSLYSAFYTAGSEKVRITNTGNVGIGTTAPLSKLGVLGSASVGATYGAIAAPTSGMIIEGNVGIGTVSPTQKLDVSGNIQTSVGSGGTLTLFESDGTRANQTIVGADASGAYMTGTYNTGGSADIRFINASTEAMRIQAGNVGIGTTAPNGKLEVKTTNTDVYSGTNSATWDSSVILSQSAAVTGYSNLINFQGTSNVNSVFGVAQNAGGYGDFVFAGYDGSFAERMRITSAGNVGIGTTTPGQKLSVAGTVGFSGLTASVGAGSLCLSASNEVVYNSGSDSCLSSTRNTKHDITALSLDAIDILNTLEPVSFIYNGTERVRYGFIAEDTASVDDILATHNANGDITGIDDRSILSVMVRGFQDFYSLVMSRFSVQDERIEALEARIRELEEREGIEEPQPEEEPTPVEETNDEEPVTEPAPAETDDTDGEIVDETQDDNVTEEPVVDEVVEEEIPEDPEITEPAQEEEVVEEVVEEPAETPTTDTSEA